MTNCNSNVNLIRTPLQPKYLNKNNFINESISKLTPCKTLDYDEFKSNNKIKQINLNKREQDLNEDLRLVDFNHNGELKESNHFFINNKRDDDIEFYYNYNFKKNCYDNHFDLGSIKQDIEIKFESCPNELMKTNNSSLDNDAQIDDNIKLAIDFFDKENFINFSYTDLDLREKIEKFTHDDLYFNFPDD
jgi:hypothetical protein